MGVDKPLNCFIVQTFVRSVELESMDMTSESTATASANRPNGTIAWLKRLGIAGFMFFFLKGMVWLAVLFGLVEACR
jgi:hypothetical protein